MPIGILQAVLGRAAGPPGPRGYPLLGVLPQMWHDPLRLLQQAALTHGDVARLGVGGHAFYLVSSPELIHHILHERWRRFWKGEGMAAAAQVVGQGLATSHGALWRRQRGIIQPAFASARVAALVPCVARRAQAMLDAWEAPAREGRALDLSPEMQHLTLRIVCEAMFGADLTHEQEARVGAATIVACDHIAHTAWRLLPLPSRLPTPQNVRFRRALADLHAAVDAIVAARRASGEAREDLLGRLLAARDERGAPLSDRQLRDELMTLFVAGHETPANALVWTLYLLALHPEAWRRVEAEVDQVLGERAAPGAGNLARLEYTGRVLQESLRLYPPGWTIVRTPFEDEELGGYRVPAGTPLLLSQWVVHRHPRLWTNPEAFDPERFTPEASQGRPRYAYFPFGGGVRVCLGNTFAMAMMKTVLAMVVRRFRLSLEVGHRVEPLALTTLRPRHGVRVRLRSRGSSSRT